MAGALFFLFVLAACSAGLRDHMWAGTSCRDLVSDCQSDEWVRQRCPDTCELQRLSARTSDMHIAEGYTFDLIKSAMAELVRSAETEDLLTASVAALRAASSLIPPIPPIPKRAPLAPTDAKSDLGQRLRDLESHLQHLDCPLLPPVLHLLDGISYSDTVRPFPRRFSVAAALLLYMLPECTDSPSERMHRAQRAIAIILNFLFSDAQVLKKEEVCINLRLHAHMKHGVHAHVPVLVPVHVPRCVPECMPALLCNTHVCVYAHIHKTHTSVSLLPRLPM